MWRKGLDWQSLFTNYQLTHYVWSIALLLVIDSPPSLGEVTRASFFGAHTTSKEEHMFLSPKEPLPPHSIQILMPNNITKPNA
jgi:hypothetical protein